MPTKSPAIEDVVPGIDELEPTPVDPGAWPTKPIPMTVHEAISHVMAAVGNVAKNQRNTDQSYNFRGIDAFYNAYHGPMAAAGLVMIPTVEHVATDERRTSTGKAMYHVVLTVRYRFIGPGGDSLDTVVIGEGQDTQDKAVTKALSAAHKYAMQQVFMPPIEEQEEADFGSEDTEYQGRGARPAVPVDPAVAPLTPDQYRTIMAAMGNLEQPAKDSVTAYVAQYELGSLKEKTMTQANADALIAYIATLAVPLGDLSDYSDEIF